MTAATDHESAASTRKTRGFMRSIGGMFHRRSARESESRNSMLDDAALVASVSQPQQTTTSSGSGSGSGSSSALRAISPEEARGADAGVTASHSRSRSTNHSSSNHQHNATSGSSNSGAPTSASTHSQSQSSGSGKNKMKAAARHVVRNPFRKKSSVSVESKESVDTAPSDDDDDDDGPQYACQFLFYSGSAEDNSFKPDKVQSSVAEIDYQSIRPSLTLQMPVFFSPPAEQTSLRRSSILTDPREYELGRMSMHASEQADADAGAEAEEIKFVEDEKTLWVDGVSF